MMSNITILFFLLVCMRSAVAQFSVNYNPKIQSSGNIQYFTPNGDNLFVGDCIPYYHEGTYYLYWLLDSGHHSALNGLGGHQWTLSTTKDLKHWTHYPVVIGIDEDWEKSICTGSVENDGKKFYAFYATRLLDSEGKVNEQLSYATSTDAIHFEKQKPNPFYTFAPGYNKKNFRDPKVIIDRSGVFHLLVSSSIEKDYSLNSNRGCLVHLSSNDLKQWKVNEPILTGQGAVPECPDYFYWNGWYYLLYSQGGNTSYLMSQKPFGPWIEPKYQVFDEDWSNVVKTAESPNGRRIAASWIPSRRDNKDNGGERFGGCILLREVLQLEDGTLANKFPEEMIPATGNELSLKFVPDHNAKKTSDSQFAIDALGSIGSLYSANIPVNCRITLEIDPSGSNEDVGLYLRSTDKASEGYKLSFSANKQIVSLANTRIEAVSGLNKPFKVDIIMKDDIIDVCINGQRCIVNRLPERKGASIWFYAKHGKVLFKDIKIYPIINDKL
jgi:sucrose-6-phosphate hydrolase SacC (GH32 family)